MVRVSLRGDSEEAERVGRMILKKKQKPAVVWLDVEGRSRKENGRILNLTRTNIR